MMLIVALYPWAEPKIILKKLFHKHKSYLNLLRISFIVGLTSCGDASLVTPPPQDFGRSLNTTAAEQYPRFSYDGRYLVLASDRQAQRSILLYDIQSRRLIPLPGLNQRRIRHDEPDISADGRYIVYVAEPSGKPDIFIYDRQTLQSENLTKNWLSEVRNPTISGNGRFVAFESNRTGQWDITIYDRGIDTQLSLPNKER
jgi:Tol biopolymer transport system component